MALNNEMTDEDWLKFMRELKELQQRQHKDLTRSVRDFKVVCDEHISPESAQRKAENIMVLINSRATSPTLEELVKLILS